LADIAVSICQYKLSQWKTSANCSGVNSPDFGLASALSRWFGRGLSKANNVNDFLKAFLLPSLEGG
jgi:hypothetical protein